MWRMLLPCGKLIGLLLFCLLFLISILFLKPNIRTVLPALRCHLRFLAIKPFLLGVKTSGFKRKICFIESTIVPGYNSVMGAIFEYDINQA